jgi:hypothetical protein
MEVYFDESGDFNPGAIGSDKFSVVMGLVIPESSAANLKSDFDWLESRLDLAERDSGEAKGTLLSLEHRKVLVEILKAHRDVMLVPVAVNLGYTDPAFLTSAPENVRKLIEKNLGQDSPYMTTVQRQELGRRFSNLSAPVFARILAYAIAILRTVEAMTLYYYCDKFHCLYDPVKITFDRVVKPDSREELVFKDALLGWLANWTSDMPLKRAPVVEMGHPLAMLYGQEKDGKLVIDLRKMLLGKIDFANSKNVWQVRLADFVANTWLRIILDHDGRKGHRALFRDLNRKTVLQGSQLLGLVGLTDDTAPVSAPPQFHLYQRMVAGDAKILPCD